MAYVACYILLEVFTFTRVIKLDSIIFNSHQNKPIKVNKVHALGGSWGGRAFLFSTEDTKRSVKYKNKYMKTPQGRREKKQTN